MIQDIQPHRMDNHFRSGQFPEDQDVLIAFSGEKVLCRMNGTAPAFPRVEEFRGKRSLLIYLFRVDEQRFFLYDGEELPPAGGYEYVAIRALRKKDAKDRHLVFAAVTARHLKVWYHDNRFCGRCGQPLVRSDKERVLCCPSCGGIVYPWINPAVIVGVTDGENLLLTRYAGRDIPFYALVAGFTEVGETLEETVEREVMEETGLAVTNIRYYKSQPWGFAEDILAGYYCDVAGAKDIRVDRSELKEAVWMPREQVPGQPDDFSLTNEMMLAFRDGLV